MELLTYSIHQRSGIDMKKLSIVGKDYHTEADVTGYYNTGDRIKYWASLEPFGGSYSEPPSSPLRRSGPCW
jgi:hypothetical protein